MPNAKGTKVRTVRIDDATWDATLKLAAKDGATASDVVRKALRALLAGAVLLTLAGCTMRAQAQQEPAVAPVQQVVAPAKATCAPAPTTAAGYAAMFATVDPAEFGAADVGISVPLADGRVVWLWGDTFSQGRFVHSTAITQDGGCLHVSHAGAQLLPNDDASHIYWIQSARAKGSTVAITARSVVLTGKGAWDFRDGGFSRTATTRIDAAGNLTFVRWGAKIKSPAPDPGRLVALGPHHYAYSFQTHPWARLASGKTLTSNAQNWDDGKVRPFSEYRLMFSER